MLYILRKSKKKRDENSLSSAAKSGHENESEHPSFPTSKQYEFVGECYMHDLMDGEALQLISDDDRRNTAITLI